MEVFFRERKDEVRKMTELDFTWEKREELIRMEERSQARIEGIVKMISKGYTREQILELDYSEEEYRQAMKIVEKK